MSKSQRTGKKFYSSRNLMNLLRILLLILIYCGPVIAMVIACLASPLSPLKISSEITVVSFLIIYTIIIVIFIIIIFSDKLRSGILRDVVNSIKNSIKSRPGYFFPPFMVCTAFGFTFLLSDFLYKFLCMSSISELLQFYPMLFAGAITSISIMFAIIYWVANRAENIAELAVTIQYIKIFAMATYILALFLVFVPLSIIPSPSNSTSTSVPCSALYYISFLLSYPFGLTAGMILTLIILDVFAVALRYKLSEK